MKWIWKWVSCLGSRSGWSSGSPSPRLDGCLRLAANTGGATATVEGRGSPRRVPVKPREIGTRGIGSACSKPVKDAILVGKTVWRAYPEVRPPMEKTLLFMKRLGVMRVGYVHCDGTIRYHGQPDRPALEEMIEWWTEAPEQPPFRSVIRREGVRL